MAEGNKNVVMLRLQGVEVKNCQSLIGSTFYLIFIHSTWGTGGNSLSLSHAATPFNTDIQIKKILPWISGEKRSRMKHDV